MKWKLPKEWQKLKSGEDCPMCGDIHLAENKFSYLVKELKSSFVRLPKNQYMRGWTIVALKKHVSELFELSPQELQDYWVDVSIVAKALDTIYKPTKINYLVYGHHCPHLHVHLLVHSFDDDPNKAVHMTEKEELLNPDEYVRMIKQLENQISLA